MKLFYENRINNFLFKLVKLYFNREVAEFYIVSLKNIIEKIIPLFDKYPIQGCKKLDSLDFREVAFLMKDKTHLTKKDLIK